MIINSQIDQIIKNALIEDSYNGDATSDRIFDVKDAGSGNLIAKEVGVLAGIDVFKRVFEIIDSRIVVTFFHEDGDMLSTGDIIGEIKGPIAGILKGERIGLNLMQRMSGIATMTNMYVKELEGLSCRLVDTRKTTPGLRVLEKYAVTVGGGFNHRMGLSDGIMIKDNHIKGAGGLGRAIDMVKRTCPHTMKVEVEIEDVEALEEAIEHGADIVMLDNMNLFDMKMAVIQNRGRVTLEASGNVTLESLREIGETGVDVISCGKLTHSVSALDISLKF